MLHVRLAPGPAPRNLSRRWDSSACLHSWCSVPCPSRLNLSRTYSIKSSSAGSATGLCLGQCCRIKPLSCKCKLGWSSQPPPDSRQHFSASSSASEAILTAQSDIQKLFVANEKIGVLLLNLGGPETLDDVQPFLFNLFADPDIIRLPRALRFLQKPLAQFISVARAPKSKEGYASIGGGSPLRQITDAQGEALMEALCGKDIPAKVYVGMRYWHPFTEEAIEQVMIFFSAHGVPLAYVEEAGDPYKAEMEECVDLIMEELEKRGMENPCTLAYQSRVGPVEWLKPYTDETIIALGQRGVKSLLAVPISFVSEHIETLEEIDVEYKELALQSGIKHWGRVPALGCEPTFISDLADAVIESLPYVGAMAVSNLEARQVTSITGHAKCILFVFYSLINHVTFQYSNMHVFFSTSR
uniref:Ferrochelatase n=1 Tax=Hordeum vulgare subsp. vulgare TaxID=112509 RepID=A0A8I6WRI0_HORVV